MISVDIILYSVGAAAVTESVSVKTAARPAITAAAGDLATVIAATSTTTEEYLCQQLLQ